MNLRDSAGGAAPATSDDTSPGPSEGGSVASADDSTSDTADAAVSDEGEDASGGDSGPAIMGQSPPEAGAAPDTDDSSSDPVMQDGNGEAGASDQASDGGSEMSEDSNPIETDPTVLANLDRMQDELVACGLWEKGDLSSNFTTLEGRCFAACFATYVDCDAASDYACRNNPPLADPESELAACIRDCQYFICGDGVRIFMFNRCDGGEDCADGSDELDCPAVQTFTCNMGNEIPAEWRCNAEIDCGQGEDEEDCEDEYFICGNGENYPSAWECDLREDCPDGSDEGPHCAKLLCE